MTGYALNLNHPEGKHKARVFKSALGYTQEDAETLKQHILESFDESKLISKGNNKFGELYEQVMMIMGKDGKTANILTAWIYQNDDYHLVTCYVTDKEASQ